MIHKLVRLILPLMVILLSGEACVKAAVPLSRPSTARSSVAKIPKDSYSLLSESLTRLTKVEESLLEIKKNLTNFQGSHGKSTDLATSSSIPFSSWQSAQYHLDYLDRLLRRGVASLTQLSVLSPRHLSASQLLLIGKIVCKIFISYTLGILLYLFFNIFMNKTADNIDYLVRRFPVIRKLNFFISIPLRFLPIFLCFMMQMVAFYMIEGSPDIRETVFSFGLGLLLLATVWKIFSLIEMPYPLEGRGRLSELVFSQHYSIFWIKSIAIAYVVEQWAMTICEIVGISWEGQRLILMLSHLIIFMLVFFCIQSLRTVLLFAVPRQKYFVRMRARIPLVATLLQGSLFFLYGTWLFSERLFENLLVLILISLGFFLVFPFLNRMISALYTGYLWKTRAKRSSLMRIFVQNHINPTYFLRILVSLIILSYVNELLEINSWVWFKVILGSSFIYKVFDVSFIICICWILVYFGSLIIQYSLENRIAASRIEYSIEEIEFRSGRTRLLGHIISGAFRMLVWICGFFLSVSALGYNIFPLLTGLGALSFSLGLGLQTFVRDIVAGFWVIYENTLVLGDNVEVDAHSGVVEEFGIRSFRLRTDSGAVLTIPFGSMITVSNKSRFFSYALFSTSVGYNEDFEKIKFLIEKTGFALQRNPHYKKYILAPLEFRGMTEVTDFSMVFSSRIKTVPGSQDEIKRAYTQMLKKTFDESGVRVPSPGCPGRLPSLINTSKG